MKKRIHAIVSGHVQGVGFRWFTVRAAKNRNITGWVRNNPDGTVETVAEGDADSIREFVEELHRGPMSASVKSVDYREEEPTGQFTSFGLPH